MEFETEAPDTQVEQTEGTPDAAQENPSVLELDAVEKFKFQGREWTPKELQNAYLMQSDYTKKTQAIAEERKFYDNLSVDLAAISKNPALVSEFKRIYPEKYHSYLSYVTPKQAEQMQQPAEKSIDPEFMSRFESLERSIREKEAAAIEAELDVKFKQLGEKYPMADEEAVIARAQSLLNKGQDLNDNTWDALWKSVNDVNQKKFEQVYQNKVKEQKTANIRGRDVAAGGGTVGQAPTKPRTIKEATDLLMSDMG